MICIYIQMSKYRNKICSIKRCHVVYVDPQYGNDCTGKVQNPDCAFQTYAAAVAAILDRSERPAEFDRWLVKLSNCTFNEDIYLYSWIDIEGESRQGTIINGQVIARSQLKINTETYVSNLTVHPPNSSAVYFDTEGSALFNNVRLLRTVPVTSLSDNYLVQILRGSLTIVDSIATLISAASPIIAMYSVSEDGLVNLVIRNTRHILTVTAYQSNNQISYIRHTNTNTDSSILSKVNTFEGTFPDTFVKYDHLLSREGAGKIKSHHDSLKFLFSAPYNVQLTNIGPSFQLPPDTKHLTAFLAESGGTQIVSKASLLDATQQGSVTVLQNISNIPLNLLEVFIVWENGSTQTNSFAVAAENMLNWSGTVSNNEVILSVSGAMPTFNIVSSINNSTKESSVEMIDADLQGLPTNYQITRAEGPNAKAKAHNHRIHDHTVLPPQPVSIDGGKSLQTSLVTDGMKLIGGQEASQTRFFSANNSTYVFEDNHTAVVVEGVGNTVVLPPIHPSFNQDRSGTKLIIKNADNNFVRVISANGARIDKQPSVTLGPLESITVLAGNKNASLANSGLVNNLQIRSPFVSDEWHVIAEVAGSTGSSGATGSVDNCFTSTCDDECNGTTVYTLEPLATTNASIVINVKGDGFFALNKPDNGVTGGNCRGKNAVDLQTNRSDASAVASGDFSVIAGGHGNTISAPDSFIANGYTNKISGVGLSFIGTGDEHVITNNHGFIGTGHANTVTGIDSFIGTGDTNSISDGGSVSFIGTGMENKITGVNSFIGNGNANVISANNAVVVTGNNNNVTGVASFIGVGGQSVINAQGSFIGVGEQCTINDPSSSGGSFIGTGTVNAINAGNAAIVTGLMNTTSGRDSFIGGGVSNNISGQGAVIGGGGQPSFGNSASGNYSFIGSGISNNVSGLGSAIVGGGQTLLGNTVSGNYSFIGGGYSNNTSGDYSFIGTGVSNNITGQGSVICGGGSSGFDPNEISGDFSFIGVGLRCVNAGLNSFIGTGLFNQITSASQNGAIISGVGNLVQQTNSFIGSGQGNNISTPNSAIVGGFTNVITGNNSFIGGGSFNTASGIGSVVCGGGETGGIGNEASGDWSSILGGIGIQTPTDFSSAVGKFNQPGTIGDPPSNRMFMVGFGGDDTTRNNLFSVTLDGNCHAQNAFLGNGADFAEWYESFDGKEIPFGTPVVFVPKTDLIAPAGKNQTPFGVVTLSASFIANSAEEHWQDMFLRDNRGRIILETYTEEVDHPDPTPENPKNTKKVLQPGKRQKLNPAYDPNKPYIPRSERKEWHPIGLTGKVKILKNSIVAPTWTYLKPFDDQYDLYFIH